MKFTSIKQRRKVNETMASLLCPLNNHCDEETKRCIEITLLVLEGTEVEEDEDVN